MRTPLIEVNSPTTVVMRNDVIFTGKSNEHLKCSCRAGRIATSLFRTPKRIYRYSDPGSDPSCVLSHVRRRFLYQRMTRSRDTRSVNTSTLAFFRGYLHRNLQDATTHLRRYVRLLTRDVLECELHQSKEPALYWPRVKREH